MAVPLGPFGAGVAIALLGLRLLLAMAQFVRNKRRRHVKTLVVLGSGGHTAEMIALLQAFDLSVYQPRCYVMAATDAMSGQKAAAFEASAASAATAALDEEAPPSASKQPARTPLKLGAAPLPAVRRSPRVAAAATASAGGRGGGAATPRRLLPGARSPESPSKRRYSQVGAQARRQASSASQQEGEPLPYTIVAIPRSREVGQSFVSSVPTTLRALWAAVAVVLEHQPDLLLLNGPGTCIPIAAAALLGRLLGLCGGRVAYVESIARVYRLSLSGKILYHSRLASPFFVQWQELAQRYPRAVYAGRLM